MIRCCQGFLLVSLNLVLHEIPFLIPYLMGLKVMNPFYSVIEQDSQEDVMAEMRQNQKNRSTVTAEFLLQEMVEILLHLVVAAHLGIRLARCKV